MKAVKHLDNIDSMLEEVRINMIHKITRLGRRAEKHGAKKVAKQCWIEYHRLIDTPAESLLNPFTRCKFQYAFELEV